MKKIFFVSALSFAVVACSDSSTEKESTQQTINTDEKAEVAVVANKVLTMEVDGMVCKMGCGGAIRKELKAAGGVSRVEFDFEEERQTNTAKIYFDDQLVDESKLIDLVKEINDGQFSVGETSIEDFVEVNTDESDTASSSDDISIDAYSDDVSLPNLFDLFRGLFS